MFSLTTNCMSDETRFKSEKSRAPKELFCLFSTLFPLISVTKSIFIVILQFNTT